MHTTNTRFWKKKSLSQYVLDSDGSLSLFVLFSLGIMAAFLHQHLRMGLDIPGHHGLEWMTLLVFGRMQSRYRWAALVVAGGAASTYMLQTTYMPLAHSFKPALIYLLNGVCVDVLFRLSSGKLPLLFKGMLLGGISYMAKPVVLIPLAILFDVSFGSFSKYGYMYPVLTHFLFGSTGAVAGIGLARLSTPERRRQ